MMEKRRVFLAGGLGFIGFFVARRLHDMGHEVMVYDNLSSYLDHAESQFESKIQYRRMELEGRAKIVQGDICDRGQLKSIMNDFSPSIIVDLAAVPVVKMVNSFARNSVRDNLVGMSSLLEAVSELKDFRQFIYVSTSYIYGDFEQDTVDENSRCQPIDLYGGTKYCGEVLTSSFSRMNGTANTIIRPCAVYGPTDANMRVVTKFLKCALENRPLEILGDADRCIDFTFVEDTAEGIALSVDNDNAFGETFNIARGNATSLRELAETIQMFFPQAKLHISDGVSEGPSRGTLSIEKANAAIGFTPKYDLKSGIERYIEFIKSHDGMV